MTSTLTALGTVSDRVAKGTAWLDQNVPGWETFVTLPEFNIRSGCRCVLGQVFSNDAVDAREWDIADGFDYAMQRLADEDHERWAVEHGFDTSGVLYRTAADYDALQDEWERVISERQAEEG